MKVTRLFQKDNGAHFSYNFGVGFMRMGLMLLLLALLFLIIIFVIPSANPKFIGKSAVRVVDTDIYEMEKNGNKTYTSYYVSFMVKLPSSDTEIYVENQSVTSKLYYDYAEKVNGKQYTYNIYRVPDCSPSDNAYYVSKKSGLLMRIEYHGFYNSKCDAALVLACFAAIALMTATFGFGISQIRLSMKYPRSDVLVESTAVVPYEEQRDLMKEFEEAQERAEIRRRLGLSADEPIPEEYLYQSEVGSEK